MPDIKIPAVEKLIDVIACGIGAVAGPLLLPYKSWMQAKADKIEAKGKAEAMKITAKGTAESTELIAQAQFKVKDMLLQRQNSVSTIQKTDIEMDTAKLIQTKVQFQEGKRLNNIRNIFIQAKNKLPEYVNNKPVDPDWIARFFQSAQDVSTEEMQQIWSSILAGEVETSGRTSLRTLDILKNMTKKEAEIFNEYMKYKINNFIPIGADNYIDPCLKRAGIDPDSHGLLLEELGLLNFWTGFSDETFSSTVKDLGDHWGYMLRLYKESKTKNIHISAIQLTQPALELSSFLNHQPDFKYLKSLAQLYRKEGSQLQIVKITGRKGKKFLYDAKNFKPIEI